jgi:hypothetical protein
MLGALNAYDIDNSNPFRKALGKLSRVIQQARKKGGTSGLSLV